LRAAIGGPAAAATGTGVGAGNDAVEQADRQAEVSSSSVARRAIRIVVAFGVWARRVALAAGNGWLSPIS
jgi:hypothetical protein